MVARDLKSILRFRKWDLDEKRRALGDLLRQEQGLRDTLLQFDEEMVSESRAAAVHASEGGWTFGAYVAASKSRRDKVEQALVETRHQIEAARNTVAETFKDFKTLEIAQENRETRGHKERDAKAQKAADDDALTIHRRRST